MKKAIIFKRSRILDFLLKYGIYIVILALFIVFSIISPSFLSVRNLVNILDQYSYYIIGAIGMMFVILVGGVDLSSGAMIAFSGIIGSLYLISTKNIPQTMLIIIGICTACGLLNGEVVSSIGVPAFVATLAFQNMWRGAGYTITLGDTISGLPRAFTRLYSTRIFGIKFSILVLIIVSLVAAYVLHFSSYGKKLYAVGDNRNAAKIMGINVRRIHCSAFVICGFLTGIATIIVTSYIGSARAATAETLSLDCIAAVIIGGANVNGGEGNIIGTIIGALLFALVKNGLNLIGLSYFWQLIVTGIIIYFAAALNRLKVRAGLD